MAQIFSKYSNTLARLSIIALAVLVISGIGLAYALQNSQYVTKQGIFVEQPVPFSHKHHGGDLKLDCRFCHSAVEDSAEAGMPTTEVCMGCHTQIWKNADVLKPIRDSYVQNKPISWWRVHDLPDFVYFNHSIHVAKGMGCVSCHGRVEDMPLTTQIKPLTMEWCLECHNHPEAYVRPNEWVTSSEEWSGEERARLAPKLIKDYHIQKRTDCYVCHR
ncbi:MAG: cytochrome c3 family protein [Chitinophagaceae bacterium]|nr:cytochrome c3 family protein [Oligoflexus sp.]